MPRFSVVVPTFGRAAYLQEAVRSVLDQSFADFECVVVDDGSPEPPTVPDDPRVRLVRLPVNGGAAAARNAGLDEARGDFVTFLDDDDVYRPDRLATAAAAAVDGRGLVSWTGRYEAPAGPPRTSRVLDGRVDNTILEAPVPHLGTCTLPRAAAVRFDTRFRVSEDVEWWLRQAQAIPFATVRHVGYLLRTHDGPRQTTQLEARLRCRLLLLEVHGDYFAAHPRSAAYQWRRAAGLAATAGDRSTARRALVQALKARPSARDAVHLARVVAGGR